MEITRRKFLEATAASAAIGVASAYGLDKAGNIPTEQLRSVVLDTGWAPRTDA